MEVSTQEFRDVQTLVRSLCGLVLTDDKTYLVKTRLEPVVTAHGCASFGDYLGRLQQLGAGAMRDELVEALTTGETSFNRDAHVFDEFRRRILSRVAESLRRRREQGTRVPVARIWSAGCSTGQEPYSLAMIIHEYLSANVALGLKVEQLPILATDVSAKSLTTAKEGRYLERDLDRGVTPEQRRRYFQQQGAHWTINPQLKKMIEFRQMNFLNPMPDIGPFELIFCRNVMIYFDTPTRQKLCEQFHKLLVPGGLLILGAAESLYGLTTSLVSESFGSTTVYRKPDRHA
ncbi:protein-glutamate O-methyltransferase CheR [Schlesneria sp. DSM 10557]|uniref:CheR family methyltransferase n=1 Tax=Schlesneria sp. DSM 10557 TaxID=3044399 RepID=UPI0035A19CFB